MRSLDVVTLGTHHIANPESGEVPFLSAASGTAWRGGHLYSVGDDQGNVAEFALEWNQVLEALRLGGQHELLSPGYAQRILPGNLPPDNAARKDAKPDFEGLTLITPGHFKQLSNAAVQARCERLFPHGLLMIAGSGGMSWSGNRRSLGVVSSLSERGHIVGLPTQVSLHELHEILEEIIGGEPNIEGVCVYGGELVLAHRGNSLDKQGQPSLNLLIRLSLTEVMKSLYTDLKVGRCEMRGVHVYDLGYAEFEHKGIIHQVKYDFTDIKALKGDSQSRLILTAAAEGIDGSPVQGMIAGSKVGIIHRDFSLGRTVPLTDRSIKLEGIDGHFDYSTGTITSLLVSDADDPNVPAPLMAARVNL